MHHCRREFDSDPREVAQRHGLRQDLEARGDHCLGSYDGGQDGRNKARPEASRGKRCD